jgi:hypothetical protein
MPFRQQLPAAMIVSLLALAPMAGNVLASPGEWKSNGAMLHPRAYPALARLSNTSVLVVGGPKEAEVYSLDDGTSYEAGALSQFLNSPSATALGDGRVLVLGAPYDQGPVAEVFDSAAMSFSLIAPPPLQGHPGPAALLGNGLVLVSGAETISNGGADVATFDVAVIFDPKSDSWAMATPMNEARGGSASASLLDGRVIVTGGRTGSMSEMQFLKSAEIYDATADKFTLAGDFQFNSTRGAILDLGDGRVLAANAGAAELLILESGKASVAYQYPTFRSSYGALLLPGPNALIFGGTTAEMFDAKNNSFESIAPPEQWRDNAAAIAGPGGKAYLFGGHYWDGASSVNLASVEVYESGFGTPGGEACEQSQECLSGFCVVGICCSDACLPEAPCLEPQCTGGTCTFTPMNSKASCIDDDPCTFDDQCNDSGQCVGVPYECEAGPCHASSECLGDGTCAISTLVEGASCELLWPCEGSGSCTAGSCVPVGSDTSCSQLSDIIENDAGEQPTDGTSSGGCAAAGPPRTSSPYSTPTILLLLLLSLAFLRIREKGY